MNESMEWIQHVWTQNEGIYSGDMVCHLKKDQARTQRHCALKVKWDLYGEMVDWRSLQAKRTAQQRHRGADGAAPGGEW